MLDIAILAGTAVQVLVPYIKRGADGLAAAIGERVDDGAADFATDVAKSVWTRVRQTFTDSGQEGAVKEFEQNPEDAQDYLEKLLKRRLEADENLARELDELVSKQAPGDGRNVVQIMNASGVAVVSGDVTGGIVAGSIGTIHQESPVTPPTADE